MQYNFDPDAHINRKKLLNILKTLIFEILSTSTYLKLAVKYLSSRNKKIDINETIMNSFAMGNVNGAFNNGIIGLPRLFKRIPKLAKIITPIAVSV